MSEEDRMDDLMERYVTGDVDRAEAEAGGPSPADLDELDLARAALERLAEADRDAVIAEARTTTFPAGEALVGGASADAAPNRTTLWTMIALAAALLVVASVVAIARFGTGSDEPGLGTSLGPSDLRELRPEGDAADWSTFTWSAPTLPSRATFEVLVFFDGEDDATPDRHASDLSAASWKPDARDVETWPDEIMWMVRVRDAGGEVIAERTASLSR